MLRSPDRMFMQLALAGRAHTLVTRDKDLLVLAADFPVPIITPANLQAMLAPRLPLR